MYLLKVFLCISFFSSFSLFGKELSVELLFPPFKGDDPKGLTVNETYLKKEKESMYPEASIIVVKDFKLKGEVFLKGDNIYWNIINKEIERLRLYKARLFGGIEWLGFNGDSTSTLYRTRTQIYFYPKTLKPKFGILGKDVTIGGNRYLAYRCICLDEMGEVRRYYPFDVRELSMVNFNIHDDKCTISHLVLEKDYEIEGVVWLKWTTLMFDKDFKWNFVRMEPGQEFQGKLYKDGGVLARGEYSNLPNGKLEILTPDMENYPH